MGTTPSRDELIDGAVAHALDEDRGGLNHFQRDMANGNDVNDEILVEGALRLLTEEYTGLGDVAVASALALRATRDAGGRLTCFSARVDLRSCADGVCDRHDFGALRGHGGERETTNPIAAGWASSYGTTSTGGPYARSTSTAS